ncbi:DUF5641 domain-containing protein [Trichonephila clavipes]|uniref:DUF5641 domain-containing protein n=1 Tax=Trichonephila clavipes TaxID=2585209 RepID=A0A8X6V9K0_TRICX|nr:DUF5641 domain-containing protein [Trichonephila clavipes]
MIQAEGILNSRPLTPLSSDADNFDVLTPGHFLIGRPITSIPEPNLIDVNENHLSRWEKITKVVQRTWKKWKSDYLNTLQARSKWITEKNDLMIGQMVLIKDDFLPINTWPLGRILEVYHGSDGKVRVVKHLSLVELKSAKNALIGVTGRIDDNNSVFALLDLDLTFSTHVYFMEQRSTESYSGGNPLGYWATRAQKSLYFDCRDYYKLLIRSSILYYI